MFSWLQSKVVLLDSGVGKLEFEVSLSLSVSFLALAFLILRLESFGELLTRSIRSFLR